MAFRVLNVIMAALFLFAAALQYNDPDPWRWAVMYSAAAVPCLLALTARLDWRVPALIGTVALIWAATHVPHVIQHGQVAHMFDQWKMTNDDVVWSRELFGLLIIAAWMAVLTAVVWRRRSATA